MGIRRLKSVKAVVEREAGAPAVGENDRFVVLRENARAGITPLLAERLLLALVALGVPTEARPKMFQRAMGVIFEMILAESGRSSAEDQKEASARTHKTIAALSPTEFPNLTELRVAILTFECPFSSSAPSTTTSRRGVPCSRFTT